MMPNQRLEKKTNVGITTTKENKTKTNNNGSHKNQLLFPFHMILFF